MHLFVYAAALEVALVMRKPPKKYSATYEIVWFRRQVVRSLQAW